LDTHLLAPELQQKWYKLLGLIESKESILSALSGGIDSSLLLYAINFALPHKVIAATVEHELIPADEVAEAEKLAESLNVPWHLVQMNALNIQQVAENAPDRCYHCKTHMFSLLKELAVKHSIKTIADGANLDDSLVYRPGNRAAQEAEIFRPLCETGLTKQEIRLLGKAAGLVNWSKPAAACLATRFPYNDKITTEKLFQVAAGEDILRQLGFHNCRLRLHGEICRIEAEKEALPSLLEKADTLTELLRGLGFIYICADINGLQSGSMDYTLTKIDSK